MISIDKHLHKFPLLLWIASCLVGFFELVESMTGGREVPFLCSVGHFPFLLITSLSAPNSYENILWILISTAYTITFITALIMLRVKSYNHIIFRLLIASLVIWIIHLAFFLTSSEYQNTVKYFYVLEKMFYSFSYNLFGMSLVLGIIIEKRYLSINERGY